MANQIQPTLKIGSSTQATLEQSPIQVQTTINIAWLQWLYENWYFQGDEPLSPVFLSELFISRYTLLAWWLLCLHDWVNATQTLDRGFFFKCLSTFVPSILISTYSTKHHNPFLIMKLVNYSPSPSENWKINHQPSSNLFYYEHISQSSSQIYFNTNRVSKLKFKLLWKKVVLSVPIIHTAFSSIFSLFSLV